MIDGNQLREEFGRYLAEHKATRWGMDAALMHVCKIAYDAGKADGPGVVPREEAIKMADSPYLKEAERLLSEYGHAVSDAVVFAQDPAGYSMRMEEATRAALLAHIQRGAVPDGWRLVPKEPTPEMLAGGWGYWLNVMTPGKQRDTAAKEYTAMLAAAPAPDHFRDAAEMVAEPAEVEHRTGPASDADMAVYQSIADGYARDTAPAPAAVPMPEPYCHLTTGSVEWMRNSPETRTVSATASGKPNENTRPVFLVEQMQLYGDAREAAGYARGGEAVSDRDCQHGQLTRVCDRCADAAEIEQLRAELERLNAGRHELQAAGTHPAPCARHCESTAFEIEIRRLRALHEEIAEIAHNGGLVGMSESDALRAIRSITLPYWRQKS